nr:DedA family inner membrane protein YqjA [Salmonella sp. NCTC 7297]
MELLTQLLNALWAQDFETLANPSMIGMLYFVLFMILFLENGLLPAAFLPGDSLLILVGVLIAKGAMGFPQTICCLPSRPAWAAGSAIFRAAGWGIPAPCKTGSLISLHIIINAPITFSINTVCRHY